MSTCLRTAAAILCLALACPPAASADVVVTWRKSGNDVRAGAPLTIVESISGSRYRQDEGPAGKPPAFSIIRDLRAMKEQLVWHTVRFIATNALLRREAESRRVSAGTPTGRTEMILGQLCREFRYTAVSEDRLQTLTGTYWVPGKAPGNREYAAMYERLSALQLRRERGEDDEDEEEREKNRPSPARIQLYNEFVSVARKNGIPYRLQLEVTGKGTPLRMTQEVEKVSTGRVPASVFAAPKNYQQRR